MSYDFKYPEIKNKDDQNGWDEKVKNREGQIIGDCHSDELSLIKKNNKAKQSPIDINTKSVQDCNLMCGLSINYKPSKCRIKKDKQNIIVLDWDHNSSITFNNKKLPLQRVYFHTPSHHFIDGNSSVMEINLYHSLSNDFLPEGKGFFVNDELKDNEGHANVDVNQEDKSLTNNDFIKKKGVILSILVNITDSHIGSKANKFLSQFITNSKFKKLKYEEDNNDFKEIFVSDDWNIEDLLPEKKSFYSYEGSLPMPPCFETFDWVVFEQHINILEEYVNIIRKEGNPNGYRNVHPLNNRLVFFSNSVEIEDTNDEDIETKADMINQMIAPIRISTNSRSGVDYRLGAKQIIDSYISGSNNKYNYDESQLKSLSNAWEELGKSGEQDLLIGEILELKEEDNDKYHDYVKNMVFDAKMFSYDNYLSIFLDNKKYGNSSLRELIVESLDKDEENINEVLEKASIELSNLNSNTEFFKKGDDSEYTYESIDNNIDKFKGININKLLIKDLQDNDKKMLLFLMNWNIDTYQNPQLVNFFDFIDSKEEKFYIHQFILEQFNLLGNDNILFKFKGEDLTYTLEGDECQTWGSNEVHYEGSLLNFFKKNIKLSKEGYDFDEMNSDLKKLARDGILNKSPSGKWKPHNKCRDPGGTKSAPWCYTKNPKKRWDYCMVPDTVGNTRKYLILVIFLLLIIVSIALVKVIFHKELFSKFIASLTGANFVSNAVFKANQVVNNVKAAT